MEETIILLESALPTPLPDAIMDALDERLSQQDWLK